MPFVLATRGGRLVSSGGQTAVSWLEHRVVLVPAKAGGGIERVACPLLTEGAVALTLRASLTFSLSFAEPGLVQPSLCYRISPQVV